MPNNASLKSNTPEIAYPYHSNVRLQNFTVFQDASFDFVPGINVLIGTNGSGKTHLLKVMYALQFGSFRKDSEEVIDALIGVFQDQPSSLVRIPVSIDTKSAHITAHSTEGFNWNFLLREDGLQYIPPSTSLGKVMTRPIFIPAIDMMGHTRRFVSTYDEYLIDFDQTHRDIVALLQSPEKRDQSSGNGTLATLTKVLGGEVEEENQRFYLRTPQGRFAMPLVAEGLRKIATLYQLIKNGFLKPGDVLFWDEPEVNLNPSLMDELISVLLALARTGVQIFLATHSYVILKELDLQSTSADKVRYFALEPTDDGTVVHATDDYAQIEPNAIAEQYDSLYDRQLTRSTGRTRAK